MKNSDGFSHELEKVNLTKIGEENSQIQIVQEFLSEYGYLDKQSYSPSLLDENTSEALKKYQHFYKIEETGEFDQETRDLMNAPRCGLPDLNNSVAFSTVCDWDRTTLRYAIDEVTTDVSREDGINAIKNAFNTWSSVSPLRFLEVSSADEPDILIGWRDANDPDHSMVGDVLAHADFPPGCSVVVNSLPLPVHFDDSEHTWCIGAFPGQFDIETVAVHEIGHILGIAHSNVFGAIMYPRVSSNTVKRSLTQDDILAVQDLYGSH
ncbi:matrixin family metalloprotease [Bacillus sp. SM2101]|uniref:matrixin family metalloprotease n=1 Tax=Bacillus sp. SM2101 TaxID=2805366 RepID=UPI001BDF7218|nr:matrixin family metalloprotease [Bacillus sp. SM2101]